MNSRFSVPEVVLNVGGGLGLYFWDLEVDSGLGNSDDGAELGLHVQTGAEFKLNTVVSLIGELKYSVAETGGDYNGHDIGGLSANAGAKLNF